MAYLYKALVIDDEIQMKETFDSYKKRLKETYNINIDFTVINNEAQYDEALTYDILLVDYDLTKGYSDKLMGDDLIKKFRERNKISKVIFFSSSFKYRPDERKYDFPFKGKTAFELINILKVDRIADKNNLQMMIDVMKSCCEEVDVVPIVLAKLLSDYKKEDIAVSYTNISGDEIDATVLLDDLLNDSVEGRNFRKKVTDMVLSVLLKYKY